MKRELYFDTDDMVIQLQDMSLVDFIGYISRKNLTL